MTKTTKKSSPSAKKKSVPTTKKKTSPKIKVESKIKKPTAMIDKKIGLKKNSSIVPKKKSNTNKTSVEKITPSKVTYVKGIKLGEEDQLQIKCIEYMKDAYPDILTVSSPAGAHLGKREGYKRKIMGNVAGKPDVEILKSASGYHSLQIELKTKKGVVSKEQKEYMKYLNNNGYLAVVVRDFDTFRKTVNDYLKGKLKK